MLHCHKAKPDASNSLIEGHVDDIHFDGSPFAQLPIVGFNKTYKMGIKDVSMTSWCYSAMTLNGCGCYSSTSISSSKPTSLCIFEYPLHTSHAITKFVQWSSWKCQCTTALYKTVHRVATWFINSIFDLREYLTADLSLILTDHSKYYPYSYLGRSEL